MIDVTFVRNKDKFAVVVQELECGVLVQPKTGVYELWIEGQYEFVARGKM